MNNENTVQVWDILVRVFHWSLVGSFLIAYVTSEDENVAHIYAGYAVLGLIVFRVIWGLIGSRYARFSDFVYSPATVIGYIKSLREGHPKRYLGHNPAGGWMIIALLVGLFAISITGLKLDAIKDAKGPLASVNVDLSIVKAARAEDDDEDERKGPRSQDEEFWEELHETATNLTLLLVFFHIAGVAVSGRLHKENLVKAMITGKKQA